MNLYPVNLDIREKRCVVVGGGQVASRKVRALIGCGARVEVISPEASGIIVKLGREGLLLYHRRNYVSGDLEGAFLVYAATDNAEVQRQVVAEAKRCNILINVADMPDSCSFQVPARVQRGDFLITISTGGSSPALSAQIRRELEKEYGLEYEQLVDLLAKIRQRVVIDGSDSAAHKLLFEKILQLNLLAQIREQNWSSLEAELCAVLPQGIDVAELILSVNKRASENEGLEGLIENNDMVKPSGDGE